MIRALVDPQAFEESVRKLPAPLQEKVRAYPPHRPYRYDRGELAASRGEQRYEKAWIQDYDTDDAGVCYGATILVLYAENPGRVRRTDGQGVEISGTPWTRLMPWEAM